MQPAHASSVRGQDLTQVCYITLALKEVTDQTEFKYLSELGWGVPLLIKYL